MRKKIRKGFLPIYRQINKLHSKQAEKQGRSTLISIILATFSAYKKYIKNKAEKQHITNSYHHRVDINIIRCKARPFFCLGRKKFFPREGNKTASHPVSA